MSDKRKPARILIIDSDDHFSQALAVYLGPKGYEVFKTSNSFFGINQFRLALEQERPFGAVVCEARMKDPDGVGVLMQVKETSPDVPFVMMSGWQFGRAVVACDQHQVPYLLKTERFSVDLEQLLRRMCR